MNIQTNNSMKGFTIIEVVLVLAIAGLIFLMVFIALPALQRNQRDQDRKSDVANISSAVTSFSSNNRGSFPSTSQLGDYIEDRSQHTETVTVNETSGAQTVTFGDDNDGMGQAIVTAQSVCGDSTSSNQQLTRGTARQFTVVTRLESGNRTYFCLDG